MLLCTVIIPIIPAFILTCIWLLWFMSPILLWKLGKLMDKQLKNSNNSNNSQLNYDYLKPVRFLALFFLSLVSIGLYFVFSLFIMAILSIATYSMDFILMMVVNYIYIAGYYMKKKFRSLNNKKINTFNLKNH